MDLMNLKNMIRIRDGLVMSWEMMERFAEPGDVIEPYCGKGDPGNHDFGMARAIEQRRRGSMSADRIRRLGSLAEKNGRTGLAALLGGIAAELQAATFDSWRIDFLQTGVELYYRLPVDLANPERISDELRDGVWKEPWLCNNVDNITGTGRTVREAIDTLSHMVHLVRSERDT